MTTCFDNILPAMANQKDMMIINEMWLKGAHRKRNEKNVKFFQLI